MDYKNLVSRPKPFTDANNKQNVGKKLLAQKPVPVSKTIIDDTDKENVSQNHIKALVSQPKGNKYKGHESYMPNILAHFQSTSAKNLASADPFDHQPDVNRRMRAILFNWLLEIAFKYSFKLRTIFLTANIFDRYLQSRRINRGQLQLVGVTCLLVASKYEDIYPPELKDLYCLCDKVYSTQQIIDCENDILLVLDFNFVFVSSLDIIELKTRLLNENDKSVEEAAELVLHVFLFHSNVAKFNSFKLADFARVIGNRLINGFKNDKNLLQAHEMQAFTDDFCAIAEVMKANRLFALETKYKDLLHKLLNSVFN